jgi:dephospho-CoA kinase
MQKIGLTGGIGSGKTTAAKLFEMLGVPVFYADLEAHYIRSQVEATEQIVRHFGSDILTENRIDKNKLAHVIFNDDEALLWINNFMHPLVEKAFVEWCEVQAEKKASFVIMEAALIYEAGFERLFDKIIVVDAPKDLRISRVMKRENISKEEVLKRMSSQIPTKEKCLKADIVFRNDEQHSLINQVTQFMQQINK